MNKKTSTKLIWNSNKHSAFTDLCEFNHNLLCCFREASNHVSHDGTVRILLLDHSGNGIGSSKIQMSGCDIRDPKLTVAPNGQLVLLAYIRFAQTNQKAAFAQSAIWTSQDGLNWSAYRLIGREHWWLWRLRWYQPESLNSDTNHQIACGFAYNRGAQALKFYSGNPKGTMNLISSEAMSKRKHNLGYPNESDMIFDGKKAFALIRRDADSCTAQLGESTYPFKKWQWHDLGIYIGGPCMLKLDAEIALVSGRLWNGLTFRTALWRLHLLSKKLELIEVFPSGGDCSYPGMILSQGRLYVSYYSSHECKISAIYLAQKQLD